MLHSFGFHSSPERTKERWKARALTMANTQREREQLKTMRHIEMWTIELQCGVICIQYTDNHKTLPHRHTYTHTYIYYIAKYTPYHFALAHWIMSMSIFYLCISLQYFLYVFEPGKMANYLKNLYCLIGKCAIGLINTHTQTNKLVNKNGWRKNTMDEWLTTRLNDLPTHFQ